MRSIFFSALLSATASLLSINALAGNSITIENAYARAVPPMATNSGAFMRLHNQTNKDIALVEAVSSVSEITELHTHINDDGVMRMRKVDKIVVPANGSVALEPGSYHVMLIELTQPLNVDDEVVTTLKFDDGSEQTIGFKARKPQAGGMNHDHSHHHHH